MAACIVYCDRWIPLVGRAIGFALPAMSASRCPVGFSPFICIRHRTLSKRLVPSPSRRWIITSTPAPLLQQPIVQLSQRDTYPKPQRLAQFSTSMGRHAVAATALEEITLPHEPEAEELPADLEKLTVKQLKELLARRLLKTSGLKAELVERLQTSTETGTTSAPEPAESVDTQPEAEAPKKMDLRELRDHLADEAVVTVRSDFGLARRSAEGVSEKRAPDETESSAGTDSITTAETPHIPETRLEETSSEMRLGVETKDVRESPMTTEQPSMPETIFEESTSVLDTISTPSEPLPEVEGSAVPVPPAITDHHSIPETIVEESVSGSDTVSTFSDTPSIQEIIDHPEIFPESTVSPIPEAKPIADVDMSAPLHDLPDSSRSEVASLETPPVLPSSLLVESSSADPIPPALTAEPSSEVISDQISAASAASIPTTPPVEALEPTSTSVPAENDIPGSSTKRESGFDGFNRLVDTAVLSHRVVRVQEALLDIHQEAGSIAKAAKQARQPKTPKAPKPARDSDEIVGQPVRQPLSGKTIKLEELMEWQPGSVFGPPQVVLQQDQTPDGHAARLEGLMHLRARMFSARGFAMEIQKGPQRTNHRLNFREFPAQYLDGFYQKFAKIVRQMCQDPDTDARSLQVYQMAWYETIKEFADADGHRFVRKFDLTKRDTQTPDETVLAVKRQAWEMRGRYKPIDALATFMAPEVILQQNADKTEWFQQRENIQAREERNAEMAREEQSLETKLHPRDAARAQERTGARGKERVGAVEAEQKAPQQPRTEGATLFSHLRNPDGREQSLAQRTSLADALKRTLEPPEIRSSPPSLAPSEFSGAKDDLRDDLPRPSDRASRVKVTSQVSEANLPRATAEPDATLPTEPKGSTIRSSILDSTAKPVRVTPPPATPEVIPLSTTESVLPNSDASKTSSDRLVLIRPTNSVETATAEKPFQKQPIEYDYQESVRELSAVLKGKRDNERPTELAPGEWRLLAYKVFRLKHMSKKLRLAITNRTRREFLRRAESDVTVGPFYTDDNPFCQIFNPMWERLGLVEYISKIESTRDENQFEVTFKDIDGASAFVNRVDQHWLYDHVVGQVYTTWRSEVEGMNAERSTARAIVTFPRPTVDIWRREAVKRGAPVGKNGYPEVQWTRAIWAVLTRMRHSIGSFGDARSFNVVEETRHRVVVEIKFQDSDVLEQFLKRKSEHYISNEWKDRFFARALYRYGLQPQYMPEPIPQDPAPSWTTLTTNILNKVYVTRPDEPSEDPVFAKIKWNGQFKR